MRIQVLSTLLLSSRAAAEVLRCTQEGIFRSTSMAGSLVADGASLAGLADAKCTFVVGASGSLTTLSSIAIDADAGYAALHVFGAFSFVFSLIAERASMRL